MSLYSSMVDAINPQYSQELQPKAPQINQGAQEAAPQSADVAKQRGVFFEKFQRFLRTPEGKLTAIGAMAAVAAPFLSCNIDATPAVKSTDNTHMSGTIKTPESQEKSKLDIIPTIFPITYAPPKNDIGMDISIPLNDPAMGAKPHGLTITVRSQSGNEATKVIQDINPDAPRVERKFINVGQKGEAITVTITADDGREWESTQTF